MYSFLAAVAAFKRDQVEIKRGRRNGFDKDNMERRISMMRKNHPEGDWRRFQQIEISWALVIQTWTYEGVKLCEIQHFTPWGMRLTMLDLLKKDKCKIRFSVKKPNVMGKR